MKKIGIIICALMIGFTVQSQEKKLNKNAKITFEVDGICGMCKKRIQKAALSTKGVKFASWSIETHKLTLVMDERKTTLSQIQKNIVNVGHDVILKDGKMVAPIEAYNSVHACCKYREDEIIQDHKGNLKKKKKNKN
ncbi:MAG: metal transporter [Flavobacteriaceae bacterium]|nr:metal transporter [Flavobacteriaceae bacterium]|tara:strand:- start:69295 stop:69705 length:411 start_codon:yes stop_codon:yes gene_type:complete